MEPLIQCARSRKINLDFTDGTFSLLTLICQRIPENRCSKGQLKVVALLLEGDANPVERVEEKAPHILPTMNLGIHRLFIAHPAFFLGPSSRDSYLDECRKYYPEIYKWLTTQKGEAANFWK